MSDPPAADREDLAVLLAAHLPVDGMHGAFCRCGWKRDGVGFPNEQWAVHVAEMQAPVVAQIRDAAAQTARAEALRASLTEGEVAEIDSAMNDHMYQHTISNHYNSFTCDMGCRMRALRQAINDVLTLRKADPS